MKKIAVFHPSTELYGADRIMVLATKALIEYQAVIYLPSNGPLLDLIRTEIPTAEIKILEGMPIISRSLFTPKGALSTLNKYIKFRSFIKRECQIHNFEQIYINTLACSIILPAIKRLNVPVFTHVHEILEHPRIAAKLTAKLAFTYSDTVVSVSQAVQNNLHSQCKKRKASSIVVHNGIRPIEPKLTIKNKRLTFYLFGRIKPEKGQWYLLEALRHIPIKELNKIEVNLVGGTLKGKEYLRVDLEKKIHAYGLEHIVKIKEFTPDISLEMAKADICLVPSLMKDPFPTTVLEAMSAGKVVIATDTGGAKEAIIHKETGFIVPSDKPKVLAATIKKLIRNRVLIEYIGFNAKTAYKENFTIKHFNERWLAAVPVA